MASQDARLSKFEADFKQQQSEMTNKIDTVLKANTDRIAEALPRDTVKNLKLSTTPVLSTCTFKEATISQTILRRPEIEIKPQQQKEPQPTLEDEFRDLHLNLPVLEVLAHVPLGDSKPFDTLADLGSCVNIIPLYLFKKLNIGLFKETDDVFDWADGTKSYPIRIKDPETPFLGGRGFLATANAIINCRMAKIAVGEGITRSVFRVKGVDLGEEEEPYWTTLRKRESYKPRPLLDGIGARTPYYAWKDFLDCHLLGEWEIARDAELNPFKEP
ncbi:hypothetical protein Tco_0011584 [Tanacetum coccineum]